MLIEKSPSIYNDYFLIGSQHFMFNQSSLVEGVSSNCSMLRGAGNDCLNLNFLQNFP